MSIFLNHDIHNPAGWVGLTAGYLENEENFFLQQRNSVVMQMHVCFA
jgi:hypothetical protein